jgi:hypothetical protein
MIYNDFLWARRNQDYYKTACNYFENFLVSHFGEFAAKFNGEEIENPCPIT